MNLLSKKRSILEKYLPGFEGNLAKIPFQKMEQVGNPAIELFRNFGGPGLLIPIEYGGKGISALDAIYVQCAIGSLAPSLAIATTMHHFTAITMIEMTTDELGLQLLKSIASQNLYLSSGFAEGRHNSSILTPFIHARRCTNGIEINGSKKPCSLSSSMDFLTVSVMIPKFSRDTPELAIAVISSDSPGIERRPFWSTSVLVGAESDEVVLKNVVVPEEYISYLGEPGKLDKIQARGFLWFEMMICAAYLGIVSRLVEKVLKDVKGVPSERNLLAIEVESAMSALEGIACTLMSCSDIGESEVARTFFVRYGVQRCIERCSILAAELLGGIAFITSSEVAYLIAASRALAFHPPSRLSASDALDKYLLGNPLKL